MKTKTLGWIIGLGAAVSSFMSCTQAAIECQVALAGSGTSYVARYTVKGAVPACAQAPGFLKKGDLIGTEYYHPPSADGMTYDPSKATMAIQADSLGAQRTLYTSVGGVDASKTHQAYGLGAFTATKPDDKDFCSVPTLASAEQDFPEVVDSTGAGAMPGTACMTDADCDALNDPNDPMSGANTASGLVCDPTAKTCKIGCFGTGSKNTCADPFQCTSTDATLGSCKLQRDTIKNQWSNFQVYVTAAAQGTQFSADLTYTENSGATGNADCTVQYSVVGMWPAVPCNKADAMGNPMPGVADYDQCNPCAEPDKGRATGSGINPNFPTVCEAIDDAGTMYCLLKGNTVPQVSDTETACP